MALVQKAFSDIITFSRSSNATRVGPTGLVEYAPHNLLTYSEQFDNAAWTKSDTTVTANAAAAPNGTVTADLVTASTSSSFGFFYSSNTFSGTFTVSVYAKAGTQRYIQLLSTGSAAYWANFDLQDGLAYAGGTTSAVSIAPVGGGWYRCSATVTDSTANQHTIGFVTSLTAGRAQTSTLNTHFYAWGAQVSVGPYPLDYTPTTSAAVYGPRFDYDPSGVTIVDPVSRNLLTYSEQFDNAAWGKTTVTVAANSIASPDGTITADLVTATAGGGGATVLSSGITVTASTAYTYSVFIKAGTATSIQLRLTDNVTGQALITANLLTGATTVSAGPYGSVTASSVEYANGWRRFIVTGTQPSGQTSASVGVYLLNNADTVYLWGAQLEAGSTATSYMVSGATNGFRAVPVTSGTATAKGLLVEEQRTNLCVYSESFNAGGWTGDGGNTVVLNSTTSPDGTVNAARIAYSSTSYRYIGLSTVVSSVYTFSIFSKLGTGGNNTIRLEGATVSATFDLSTGTVISNSGVSASISNCGNGWYRCALSMTAVAVTTYPAFVINGTFTSGQGHFFWGGQFELGSFATSYLPAPASTVTRSADVASVNTLSPWFNATEGTLFGEYDFNGLAPSTTQTAATIAGATTSNYTFIGKGSNGFNYFEVISGGSTSAALSFTSPSVSTTYKLAAAYKVNDFAGSLNGGAVQTDTSGVLPASSVELNIGSLISAAPLYLNGHIRRIAYYPRRLQNAELQALSA